MVIILTYSTIENNRSILMAALQSDLLNFQKYLLQLQGVVLIIITQIETLLSQFTHVSFLDIAGSLAN